MRIAGVRLDDGRMVWLDAAEVEVVPLSWVKVRLVDGDRDGDVFVTPDEFLNTPAHLDGIVVESRPPHSPDPDCSYLPGSEFPALGETVRRGEFEGMIVALDPVQQQVTIAPASGTPMVVPWKDPVGG